MTIHLKNTLTQCFYQFKIYVVIKKVYLCQLVVFKTYAIMKSLLFQLAAMNIYREQSMRDVSWNQLKSEKIDILYIFSCDYVTDSWYTSILWKFKAACRSFSVIFEFEQW